VSFSDQDVLFASEPKHLGTGLGLGLHIVDVAPQNVLSVLMYLYLSGVRTFSALWKLSTRGYTRSPRTDSVSKAAYNLSHMLLKLSYVALYLRILPTSKYRPVLYVAMGIITAFGLPATILSIFLCYPIPAAWDYSVQGKCINMMAFVVSNSAINMVFDVIVFVLPLPFLRQIRRKNSSFLKRALHIDGL
jgi:hypothetical protein